MTPNPDRRVSTQLKTWLSAVGITFEDTTTGLIVTNKAGARVPVSVLGKDETPPAGILSVRDFTSRKLQKSLEDFNALQLALGFEPKKPVNRGKIPEHKAHYGSEFELVAMRHNEFRRSPNPPPGKLASYNVVIKKAVWRFYRKNQQLCQDHLYGPDDLCSYAQIWTVNYISLYEAAGAAQSDRERFLFQFLRQKFTEFRGLLAKKGRNTLPMLDDAHIAIHARPYDYANAESWYAEEDPVVEVADTQTVEDLVEMDSLEAHEAVRRVPQRLNLADRLGALPHEKMVQVLSEAVSNDRIHVDARREASRRLQAHAKRCDECSKREDLPKVAGDDSVPGDLPIEDECGNVYANPREAAKALGVFPSNVRAVLSGRYSHTGHHTFKYVQPSAGKVDGEVAGADATGGVE